MFKIFKIFKPKKEPREENHPVKMTRDPHRLRGSSLTQMKKGMLFPKITDQEE